MVILDHVVPLVLLSHLITLPVWPDKVNEPEFELEQTVAPPLIEPVTVVGDTVIETADVVTDEQDPDWTTALYWVVVVKLV